MKKQIVLALAALGALTWSVVADELEHGFCAPPDSAKPYTWWHWINGNVTKEGITADLEAMKKAGLGGAQIFNVSVGIIPGPVVFMSDEWRALVQHAADEAKRLGLELCIHNCAGWSSSGGPWNTPENSMQVVVSSETNVAGPGTIHGVLPKPFARLNWYRDIAVVAVPSAGKTMQECSPEVTSGYRKFDPKKLIDHDWGTTASLPLPERGKPQYIQFIFPEPFTARSLAVVAGSHNGHGGEIQVSQDGVKFETIKKFALSDDKCDRVLSGIGFNTVTARYFRIVFTKPGHRAKNITLAEATFSPNRCLDDWAVKAGFAPRPGPIEADTSTDGILKKSDITDLTAQMKPDGSFTWEAPAGQWRVIRIGHTSTGVPNHPAAVGGEGLECDKLSTKALDLHWNGMMKKILADTGGASGGLRASLIDSYEVGCQNWTPLFREEFKQRRGYDLEPFFPALAGRIVESADVTERFYWDYRKTIAELFAENYYGHFAELCRRNNLISYFEPYGNGNFDQIAAGRYADVPMGEFWSGKSDVSALQGIPVSIAHTSGKTVAGAESFTVTTHTAGPEGAGWRDHPYALKALGDAKYCSGINRFIVHSYAMQPWLNRFPGMTMGGCGIHFDRMTTWWKAAPAWTAYLSRCQFLLQRGLFAADVAAFVGERVPDYAKTAKVPPGYAFDHIHPIILARMTVKNGWLVLPQGLRYRLLALPDDNVSMTLDTARKIRDLISQGAIMSGPKPSRTPGLTGFPSSETELKKIVDEVWGQCDGKTVFENRCGKGRVFWGRSLEEVLPAIDCKPDFEHTGGDEINYIHRTDGDADIYFVAADTKKPSYAECTFRVSGKEPEFFHPDTGIIERCAVWRETGGRITIPIAFDPAGSVFVVFRNKPGAHFADVRPAAATGQTASGDLVIRKAWYGHPDNVKKRVDITEKLRAKVQNNALNVVINKKFVGEDPANGVRKKAFIEYAFGAAVKTMEIPERGVLIITAQAAMADPGCRVSAVAGGFEIASKKGGTFVLKSPEGDETTVNLNLPPSPVPIEGPWEVRFPPGWNAPERTTFDKLISWPEHSDPGIKYFSGTAAYLKKFDLSAGLIAENRRLYLDLGDVQVIAEVTLNGKDLGILWKPPFRAEVTGVVRPGGNDLEVKIINLWPNRLIGDEQYPDDCTADGTWKVGGIKEWPAWLTNGQPRPEPRRLTFTTWKHWQKGDKLLFSGLLGPVTIIAAEVKTMEVK